MSVDVKGVKGVCVFYCHGVRERETEKEEERGRLNDT